MNNELKKNTEEVELNIQGLLVYLCQNRRKMIVSIVFFGVLFISFSCVSILASRLDKVKYEEERLQYENQVEYNKQEKAISKEKIALYSSQIMEQQEYINDSLYMDIDANKVYKAKRMFYVKTDYEIIPSMVYQNVDRTATIVNMYVNLINNEEYLGSLAESFGIELRYLQEVISVYNNGDGVLVIGAIASNPTDLQTIIEYLSDGVEKYKNEIKVAVDDFEITQVSVSSYVEKDESVRETQVSHKTKLSDLSSSYEEERDNLRKLSLVVIKDRGYTTLGVLKRIIKNSILGVFVGAIFFILYGFSKYTFSGTMYSVEDFENRYNIRILGCIQDTNKDKDWLLRFIDNKKDIINKIDINYSYACIKKYVKLNGNVLIVGTNDIPEIGGIYDKMSSFSKEYSFKQASLDKSSEVLEDIEDFDGIILVEKCGVSMYKNIDKVLEMITTIGGKILGIVIIK